MAEDPPPYSSSSDHQPSAPVEQTSSFYVNNNSPEAPLTSAEDEEAPTGVITQPAFEFGREPTQIECPFCHSQITTNVKPAISVLAYVLCFGLCLCGCCLGCCLIPFCLSDLKDWKHYCPDCGRKIGVAVEE